MENKIYERQILRKIKHQNRNEHITMCPCIKLRLDLGTKLVQKKINIKTVISM